MAITREDALTYVSYVVDTALSTDCGDGDMDRAVLVGWQCGFEPMFVAVIGALMNTKGVRDIPDADEAEEIATDLLRERNWFSGEPREADYVVLPE